MSEIHRPNLATPVLPVSAAAAMRLALRERLAGLGLLQRFALVGSVVSLIGMLVIGGLVSRSIETGVVRNSAISSAVYMESFIAPLSQPLAEARHLSPEAITHMRDLLERPPLSERVWSVKIWRADGFVAFSSDASLIGQTFAPSTELEAALKGQLSASFDQLEDAESMNERQSGVPLLEVYNPIHSILTGEVIAVAEFYLVATELEADIWAAGAKAWAMVAAVTVVTFAALFGIVQSGSRTIATQTSALASRLEELAQISAQNEALRARVQEAAMRVSERTERQMRRISAELHDGPAQALALASLRLDALVRRAHLSREDAEAQALREALDEALADVRDLCRGLTLPDLRGSTVAQVLDRAIGAQERRTGTTVIRDTAQGNWPDVPASHPILICLYRFVQEGLMNSYRHAAGSEVRVSCALDGGRLTVMVADAGPGFDPARQVEPNSAGTGLGLSGLRERVESIGGSFSIATALGQGVRLQLELPVEES
jgi:signal transduction histidine kinase